MTEVRVTAYTDGSCLGNPGPGGWAVILLKDGQRKELSGAEHSTTNNRMEMQAALAALRAVNPSRHLTVKTDSELLVKGMTEWLAGWKAKGWRTAAKKPVANADLWEQLDGATLFRTGATVWEWVKGHAEDSFNNAADALARAAVERIARAA